MNILIVTDKFGTAIDRLARATQEHEKQFNIRVMPIHPKRPDQGSLAIFQELATQWADVIDYQYWKTAQMLRAKFPEVLKTPSILTHHNPYNLQESHWKDYQKVIVKNSTMQKELPDAELIPHGIDLSHFPWNRDYTEQKTVGMVAFRIEGKKGILPVAQACKELGYKFILVGNPSDENYVVKIKNEGADIWLDVDDDKLLQLYRQMGIFVGNSVDNFESGTLPLLEAMAVGVPVLTRNVGMVPDISNGENMMVREGDVEDIEQIKEQLKALMEDRDKRIKIREAAWQTVKNRDIRMMTRRYAQIYMEMKSSQDIVSVIVPTFNRAEHLPKLLSSLDKQTWQNLEIILCDDGSTDNTPDIVQARAVIKRPFSYIRTGTTEEYGLAKARNIGAFQAIGKILIFLDDRYIPEPNAIEELVSNLNEKTWTFGDKGTNKKAFIENFAAIFRDEFFQAGMFNERLTMYGGLSQETRWRFTAQGFKFIRVESAKAKEVIGSKAKHSKRQEIVEAKFLLNKIGAV